MGILSIYILLFLLGILFVRIVMGKYTTRFILFLFAYIPIYFIIILKTIDLNIFNCFGIIYNFKHILTLNLIPISLTILVIALLSYFLIHEHQSLKAHGNPKFTISSIEQNNKEYITYLGTYILPFIAIETKGIPDVLAYIFLFITMGFIFARTNLIYTNPMLMFFDYDIFEVIDTNGNKFTCISKEKFKVGDSPIGIKLSENTFIIQPWKKENLEKN